ncbi:hypothetical protein JCM33374_g5363 [Metschnikowia sp. JCM 33374]|nr:hypothetical protein JCM33374_g5363 [Metschnikowia sp. JCM 33374]
MSDSHTKQVNSAVSHTIANYQLTSKSKSLRRLSPKNSEKISRVILEQKQDKHLMELIKKRDYYTRKIHELLNESGEELNPQLIEDEAEAEHYIRKILLKDHDKVHQIKSLIQKHKHFQEASAREQDELLRKYSGKRSSISGLKKLDSMNAAADAKLKSEREEQLSKFYTNLLQRQTDYSLESENILRYLQVPFFNSLPGRRQTSSKQKMFVLDLLYKTLGGGL